MAFLQIMKIFFSCNKFSLAQPVKWFCNNFVIAVASIYVIPETFNKKYKPEVLSKWMSEWINECLNIIVKVWLYNHKFDEKIW